MALTLGQVIESAKAEFTDILDHGRITDSEDADERATELACAIAKRFGYEYPDSEDYETIVSALFIIAGKRFPQDN